MAGKRFSRLALTEHLRVQESVSNYLMPASYDPETKSFALADGSVGGMVELFPLASSQMSDAMLEGFSDSIAEALSRIDELAYAQTIIVPTAQIDDILDNYRRSGGSSHPVIASIERKKIAFFRDTTSRPAFTIQGDGQFKTRRFRTFICVVIRPDRMVGGGSSSLFDFFSDILTIFDKPKSKVKGDAAGVFEMSQAEERYYDLLQEMTGKLNTALDRIGTTLANNRVKSWRLHAGDLIEITRAMLFPVSSATMKSTWDETRQISEQIPLSEVTINAPTGVIYSDNRFFKMLSLSGAPQWTNPGLLTSPHPGLSLNSLLDFLGDGFICVSACRMPRDDMRLKIEKEVTRIKGGFAMPGKVDTLLQDFRLMQHWLEAEKRGMFLSLVSVCVVANDEGKVAESAKRMRDRLALLSLDTRIEEHLAPSLFFQSMPFGFAPTLDESKRLFLNPDRVISDLMPIYGSSRGTASASFLVHNRRGEPFALDFFDSQTAPHFLIVGESGSGKSFFATNLIADFARNDKAMVFALDRGRSFATITSMFGAAGGYNNLGLSQKTCNNVFDGIFRDSSAFLVQFIAHLSAQSEAEELTSEEKGLVSECIRTTYSNRQRTYKFRDLKRDVLDTLKGQRYWIDTVRKRMVIPGMDALKRSQIEQLKTRESGRVPEFEIRIQAHLTGRTVRDRETQKVVAEEVYSDSRSLEPQTRDLLESRGIVIEDKLGPDGVFLNILYADDNVERTLEMAGFKFTRNIDEAILMVAEEADVKELSENEVVPVYSPAFLDESRERIRKGVWEDPIYSRAADEDRWQIVEDRMRTIKPIDFYGWLEGTCLIQFEVKLSDFIETLKFHKDDRCRNLIRRLSPYYGNGPYAGFFDGSTEFKFDGMKLITFELQELNSAGDHLVAAVIGALLHQIMLYCQRPENRPLRKMLIMDELWGLIKIPMVGETVVNLYRTARKFGASVGAISQLVSDFSGSDVGKAILNGSQHRILLRQPTEVVKAMNDTLGFSAEKQYLMATVHSAKGMYSEALIDISSQGICEVVRLVPNPYFYWIATTDMMDVQARDHRRNELKAQHGLSNEDALDQALTELSLQYPNGIKNSKRPS